MPHHSILPCIILFCIISCSRADPILFDQTLYAAKVRTLEDTIGAVVIRTSLNYNTSEIKNFTTLQYSLYRSDSNYFSVDNGVVTLKQDLPTRRQYSFQINLLYIASVFSGLSRTGFISTEARVQAIGPVYFDNSSYTIRISTELNVADEIYDFMPHIMVNRSAFKTVFFDFEYLFSSYFTLQATTGKLFLRRKLSPRSYSIRVEVDYSVRLMNNTLVRDDDRVYVTIIAVGCTTLEEMKSQWPQSYPCSGHRTSCSNMGREFSGGVVSRICNDDGQWLLPDYSQCTVTEGTKPFALAWLTFGTISGTYITNQLPSIYIDMLRLFPTGSVHNITLVTGFRSNVKYGFVAGFKLMINDLSKLPESDINSAIRVLRLALRIGRIYLDRDRQARGIRVFSSRTTCSVSSMMNESSLFQVCGGSNCTNCSTNIINDGSCKAVVYPIDEIPPTPVPRNETTPSYVSLNATDYTAKVSAFAPTGTPVVTIGYTIAGDEVSEVSNIYYDISGFYADYFKIGGKSGKLTVQSTLSSLTYNFDVSLFYTAKYKNGTIAHNYTESDISITSIAGIGFNETQYYFTIETDYKVNSTIVGTMKDHLINDSYIQDYQINFYRISDSRFSIDPLNGVIRISKELDPRRSHYTRVYLSYNGTLTTTGKNYSGSASVPVRIITKGCFEAENGNVVWPATHLCKNVTHMCSDIDKAFNGVGSVTRYCSRSGEWLQPDFSQCSLKRDAKSFVHIYFTFYTSRATYIQSNLASIFLSVRGHLNGLNTTNVELYSLKRSIVLFGFVGVFRAEVESANDVALTQINSTITNITTLDRIRLQIKGKGIWGISTSNKCEHPDYTSNAENAIKFMPVCKTTGSITCNCDQNEPIPQVCIASPVPSPTVTSTPTSTATFSASSSTAMPSPTVIPAGLLASIGAVSTSSIEVQMSDDSPDLDHFEVSYTAVISYKDSDGKDRTFSVKRQISTKLASIVFKPLEASTEYTFMIKSYKKDGKTSTKRLHQYTNSGSQEKPSFVELHFTGVDGCQDWNKDGQQMQQLVASLAEQIAIYCSCEYDKNYIEVWAIKCAAATKDLVMTGRLIATDKTTGASLKEAMTNWLSTTENPALTVNNNKLVVDQDCSVDIDHPYGSTCIDQVTGNAGAVTGGTGNNNNDDNGDNAGAIVGGLVAALTIICITVIVLVVIVLLVRKKNSSNSKPKPSNTKYNADSMEVKLEGDF